MIVLKTQLSSIWLSLSRHPSLTHNQSLMQFNMLRHQAPPVRDGSRNTSVLVAAPAPAQSPRPAQQRPVAEVSEAGEETETAESADSSTAVAEVGRAGLLFGLSGRTWCLAAAGGFVLALLFLPTRRRVLLRQTVAGQA